MSPSLRELVVSPAGTVWDRALPKQLWGGMQPSLERCPQPGLSLTFSAHWRWLSTGSSAPGLTCCYISCQVLELKECWCCHITACIVACLFNTITAKKIMLLGSPSKWTRGNTRYWLGMAGDEQLSRTIPLPAVVLQSLK